MEGEPEELQVIKSELDIETVDQGHENTPPCARQSVKLEPEDGASLSNLTDPGGDTFSLPTEGAFEFHAIDVEENPLLSIQLPPPAEGGDPQMKARRVKKEFSEKDPLDTAPGTVRTSSTDDRKSLVDVTIPIALIEVKLEDKSSTQCRVVGAERSPLGPPNAPTQEELKSSIQSIPMPPGASGGSNSDCAGAKKPRKRTIAGDMSDAKRELVALQLAIAKKRLKRLKGTSSIAAAEASLRRTQYEIKLQTIKRKYERELEKEKLRAEILRIDVEIKKCILLKKRAQRDST